MNENSKSINVTIKVRDELYPCYPTMGALVNFNKQTGHDVTDENGKSLINGITETTLYLYECTRSACKREQKQFDYSLDDFSDCVLPDDVVSTFMSMNGETSDDSVDAKKKD